MTTRGILLASQPAWGSNGRHEGREKGGRGGEERGGKEGEGRGEEGRGGRGVTYPVWGRGMGKEGRMREGVEVGGEGGRGTPLLSGKGWVEGEEKGTPILSWKGKEGWEGAPVQVPPPLSSPPYLCLFLPLDRQTDTLTFTFHHTMYMGGNNS